MRPVSAIGRDDAFAPFVTDTTVWSDKIVKYFRDQPLALRKMCRSIEEVQFDGTTDHETALLEDINSPEYAFEPNNMTTMIEGRPVTVKIPQFFFSASLLREKWKALFANRARLPILLARMVEKIKIEEDIKGFQGDARTGMQGLIGPATTNLGDYSALNMMEDADGDGILENLQEVVDDALGVFVAEGIGHVPVDIVFTSWLFNGAKNRVIPYQPGVNNMHLIANKINGGEIMVTNNIMEGVTVENNGILFVARMPEDSPSWQIISSGIEQNMQPHGLWKEEYGIRERFAVKILDGRIILYAKHLDASKPEEIEEPAP